jgi:hypothetical protein
MRNEDERVSGMVVGVVCSVCRVDMSHLDSRCLQMVANLTFVAMGARGLVSVRTLGSLRV